MRYCTFIFSMSCRIASVTSYLGGIEAKNVQNGDVHIAQIPDFEMEYLENHLADWGRWWLVFCIIHALSFELNFFFDRRFPLSLSKSQRHWKRKLPEQNMNMWKYSNNNLLLLNPKMMTNMHFCPKGPAICKISQQIFTFSNRLKISGPDLIAMNNSDLNWDFICSPSDV